MMRTRLLLASLLAVTIDGSPAIAQRTSLESQLPRDSSVELLFQRLAPPQRVRVRTYNGDRVEGVVTSVVARRSSFLIDGRQAPVELAAVDSLWFGRTQAKRGFAIGAVSGGALSMVFWGAVCTGLSEGHGCHEWGKVALFSVPEALLTGIAGAVVGHRIRRWDLRYAAPE